MSVGFVFVCKCTCIPLCRVTCFFPEEHAFIEDAQTPCMIVQNSSQTALTRCALQDGNSTLKGNGHAFHQEMCLWAVVVVHLQRAINKILTTLM